MNELIFIIVWFAIGACGTYIMCKSCAIEIDTWEDLLKFVFLSSLGVVTFIVVMGCCLVVIINKNITKRLPWKKKVDRLKSL